MEQTLRKLLRETWASPVFGDSFPSVVASQQNRVTETAQILAQHFSKGLYSYIRPVYTDKSEAEVRAIVSQIAPKTISFCPALTAGEFDDQQQLLAISLAIGLMYWGDQTMDRGDLAMPYAIRLLVGEHPAIPNNLRLTAARQHRALRGIREQVTRFSQPEDAALVLDCFDRQVLMNEVRLDMLSRQYTDCPTDIRQDFLATHASRIARYMVVDAGFPSVSSSLYTIYRQYEPDLPPLAEIYASQELTRLLQICNAVVRVADELGDWQMDSGTHPEWGSFCINLFNQAHPALLAAFFTLADIPLSLQPTLRQAFTAFQDDKTREAAGETVMHIFFDHVKTAIQTLPLDAQRRYTRYITLCKRVLEIGYVNRVGDITLSGISE